MTYIPKSVNLVTPLFDPPMEFKEVIDLYINEFWNPIHSRSSLMLYHYTKKSGLEGIIKGRSFHLTNTKLLKDKTELKYGRKIIIATLNDSLNFVNDKVVEFILKQLLQIIEINLYDTFITCFSEKGNSPSQWEEYADNFNGYNLEVNINSKTKISFELNNISQNNYHPVLRKVVYDEERQREIIDKYISTIINGVKNVLRRNSINEEWKIYIAPSVINILLEMIFSFKDCKYKKEEEWRLVHVRQKPNNIDLVPYLEGYLYEYKNGNFEFTLHTLRFGSKLDEVSTQLSLKDFLKNNYNYSHPLIIKHDIKTIRGLEKDDC